MPYTVEIWCGAEGCEEDNYPPRGEAKSTQKAARHAEADARKQRWVKRGTEWICPKCRTRLAAKALETSSSAGVAAYQARTS